MNESVEIIAIGDEVLLGEVSEDNTVYLSIVLTSVGLAPQRCAILADNTELIAYELSGAIQRSRIVIVTGGLGPTIDDVTKDAVIEAFGLETEVRSEIVDDIASRFRALGREMSDSYQDQGRVPKGAEILPNTVGAAVGLRIDVGESRLFLLPGVPEEMKVMFTDHVLPALDAPGGVSKKRLRTFGLSETDVEDILRDLIDDELLGALSIISSPSGVDIYVPGDIKPQVFHAITDALGTTLYGAGEESLEENILRLLANKRKSLAIAESMTGGLVAHLIVSIPGASRQFLEGFVTYSNEAKIERLGLDAEAIQRHGAVSEEVCTAMAVGARDSAGSDCALSTTGIAGPEGGSQQKPVGLCYVGLAAAGECFCKKLRLAGDRDLIRYRAAYAALDLLRLYLMGDNERLEPYRRKS